MRTYYIRDIILISCDKIENRLTAKGFERTKADRQKDKRKKLFLNYNRMKTK